MRNKLLTTRYLQPGETEPDMYKRVASAVCRNRYGNEFTQEVTAAMQNFFFLPNSPTLANAGTSKVGGLSACYVLPIHDSLDNIYKTLRDAALVHKFFGGTGFDFSEVRPRGSPIESTGGSACGVLKVIELFNQSADTIRQGGKREGANMGILRCDHPDIEEFIRAKEQDGVLSHFNLSVAATDDFMKHGDSDLIDQIVHHAWLRGDPGIIFIDTVNRYNVNKHLYDIAATNPCITGDTIVPTIHGLKYMSDISIGDQVYVGDSKFETIVEFMDLGVQPVYELITERGYRIKCTADHRVCTSTGLKRVDALTLEDDIEVQWDGYLPEGGDFDEGYLSGIIFGDGWVSNNRVGITFSTEDRDEAEHVLSYINSRWNTSLTIREYTQRSGNTVLRITSGQKSFYEFGKNSKDISWCINHQKEWLKGFISGWLFADGHVERSNSMSIALTCSNRTYVDALSTILLQFGIYISNVYAVPRKGHYTDEMYGFTTNNQSYRVSITGEDKKLLIDTIPMTGSIKRNLNIKRIKSSHKEKRFQKILSINYVGDENVYDFTTDGNKLFFGNGIRTLDCGEQPLGPYESCNLGSLNLSKFCIEGDFDFDLFKEHIRMGVRFLDSVIDINNFPIPEIREATLLTRKIGLGIMGWHDLLIQLEIPYASREAMEPIHTIGAVLKKTAIDESCILAEEYGPYPAWEGSEWHKQGIEIRNSTLLTIAPTGTISYLAGCSSGIEPHFAKEYTRESEAGTEKFVIDIDDSDISHNIHYLWHLNHQANWQKYIDNAVSKTINLPSTATEDDIREIYKTSHQLGCKGVTIYRDGSKTSQVLTTSSAPHSTPKLQSLLPPGVTRRPGHIYTLPSGCGTMRVIIAAEDERYESLREVFVLTAGGCTANNESTGRQISNSLEYGMPATLISSTLHKVKCINAMKNKESIGKSCSDNIGLCIDWELRDFVKGAQAPIVQVPTCPDCHKPLSFGSGCAQGECPHCGWNGCS